MRTYEQVITEIELDEEVIAETISNIEDYLQGEEQGTWEQEYYKAADYIESVYEAWAPDLDTEQRMTGKILGAVGLARFTMKYGESDQNPGLYSGMYEDRVLATYHHAGHPKSFIQNMFQYAHAVNEAHSGTYDEAAFVRFPIIGAFHDAIMGNGRGIDERQSAKLAMELMSKLGFTILPDEAVGGAIDATTWNAELFQQSVDLSKPYLSYQRAAAVADLLPMFDRRGPYQGICVTIEDMCKKMNGQIFTRIADEYDFSLEAASIDSCMALIDASEALRAKYGELLAGQAAFFTSFTPGDPELDSYFPGRPANISFLSEISEAFSAGRITAVETLLAARDYMSMQ